MSCCQTCKQPLSRHRYESGRLEDLRKFSKRKYCSDPCARSGRRIDVPDYAIRLDASGKGFRYLATCVRCNRQRVTSAASPNSIPKHCSKCCNKGRPGPGKRTEPHWHTLYHRWNAMIRRCSDMATGASREQYYGRGIRVCDEWKQSFLAFYQWAMSNGFEPDLTIERKNNNGGYSPDNCKWATVIEQAHNTRTNTLTENDVAHMRQLHQQGIRCATIASMYGLNRGNASRILRGLAWKNPNQHSYQVAS